MQAAKQSLWAAVSTGCWSFAAEQTFGEDRRCCISEFLQSMCFWLRVISLTKQDDLATLVAHCKSSGGTNFLRLTTCLFHALRPAGDPPWCGHKRLPCWDTKKAVTEAVLSNEDHTWRDRECNSATWYEDTRVAKWFASKALVNHPMGMDS